MIIEKPDLEPFLLSPREEVFKCSIFKAFKQTASTKDSAAQLSVYTLKCANWVNVIPVTSSGEILLVEQHRFGTNAFTLETPGGAVDPHEKDLTLAAVRELEEETGFTSKRILSLPGFGPNPAIQDNRITYFIAFDVQPLAQPVELDDPFEVIKLHKIPIEEALTLARIGRVQNALCALALLLSEPYLQSYLKKENR